MRYTDANYEWEDEYGGWRNPRWREPIRRKDGLEPFDFSRLYGNEKYSLQGMILAEYKAPQILPKGMKCHSLYADRIYKEWYESCKDIKSSENGDAFWHGVKNKDLIKFAARVLAAVTEGWDLEKATAAVTGVRIVRYTDGGGYPCNRLDIIYKD